ncbi:MAG: response regulator transcription factor [Halobacteriaceae archaeon]
MSPDDSPSVLVVDDDEDLADTYSIWLDQEGMDVRTAYRGDESLSVLDPSVDVVLLDRRMPAVPGDEVLREIRDRDAEFQVSFLTAIEPDPHIVELPFDDYLVKPVSKREVVDTVEGLQRRSELDGDIDEFFRLSLKLSILESCDVDRYDETLADLQDRVERKRSEINQRLDALDDDHNVFSIVEE